MHKIIFIMFTSNNIFVRILRYSIRFLKRSPTFNLCFVLFMCQNNVYKSLHIDLFSLFFENRTPGSHLSFYRRFPKILAKISFTKSVFVKSSSFSILNTTLRNFRKRFLSTFDFKTLINQTFKNQQVVNTNFSFLLIRLAIFDLRCKKDKKTRHAEIVKGLKYLGHRAERIH